jgi:hypothetical protein
MARASEASVTAPVMYDVAMSLKTDVTYTLKADGFLTGSERASTPRVLARSGEAFSISSENDGAKWTAEFVVTKAGPGGDVVKLAGTIKDESAIVSRPTLLVRLGGPAKIKIDKGDGKSFELAMTITEATQAKP